MECRSRVQPVADWRYIYLAVVFGYALPVAGQKDHKRKHAASILPSCANKVLADAGGAFMQQRTGKRDAADRQDIEQDIEVAAHI